MDDSRDDVFHVERIERKAARVRDTLQGLLSSDERTRVELQEVIAELTSLQAQIAEWVELHRLLHELLVTFAPLRAWLILPRENGFDAAERQLLLQNWRPCQDVWAIREKDRRSISIGATERPGRQVGEIRGSGAHSSVE